MVQALAVNLPAGYGGGVPQRVRKAIKKCDSSTLTRWDGCSYVVINSGVLGYLERTAGKFGSCHIASIACGPEGTVSPKRL